jgi:cold shock CspA family protein
MYVPTQIAFHNLPPSAAVEEKVRTLAESLEDHGARIMSCRVVIDQPHRHHRDGNLYNVRIDLKVPGAELVVKREPGDHAELKDLDAAIHEAFEEARRRIETHTLKVRGHVKTHELAPRGRVARLFPDRGFGFLQTPEGREIYFHSHAVLNGGFARLDVGTEVSFIEELGEKGPQASTVRAVGRHNHS